jgi:hypothetical protein
MSIDVSKNLVEVFTSDAQTSSVSKNLVEVFTSDASPEEVSSTSVDVLIVSAAAEVVSSTSVDVLTVPTVSEVVSSTSVDVLSITTAPTINISKYIHEVFTTSDPCIDIWCVGGPTNRVSTAVGEVAFFEYAPKTAWVSKTAAEVLYYSGLPAVCNVSKAVGEVLLVQNADGADHTDVTSEPIKWLHSQRHIWNFLFATINEAKAGGRGFELCFVFETLTGYAFVENGSDYTPNNTSILTTAVGGDTRWLGVFGQYDYFRLASQDDNGTGDGTGDDTGDDTGTGDDTNVPDSDCVNIWCIPDDAITQPLPESDCSEPWCIDVAEDDCIDPWCSEVEVDDDTVNPWIVED